MADYRRVFAPGGTYFFTLVTADRRPWMGSARGRHVLGQALRAVRLYRPFRTDAIVVLPDHLHCIWTLPPGDTDFPGRWKSVKQRCTRMLVREALVSGPAFQRHFWEHLVRDEADLHRHLDYIHYNPVKHGHCHWAREWPASSFARYVRAGVYTSDWGGPMDGFEPPE